MEDSIDKKCFLGVNAVGSGYTMSELLYREFCNHVYLGQWELARCCALTLIKCEEFSDKQKTAVITTLKRIAEDPYEARTSWSSFPSPSYVSWLSCRLLQQINENETDVKSLRDNAEFNIMLEEILPKASDAVIKELSWLHSKILHFSQIQVKYDEDEQELELSEESCIVLREALLQEPCTTTCLLEKIISSESSKIFRKINLKVSVIYLKCLIYCLKQLEFYTSSKNQESNDKVEKMIEKIYLFLSLLPECVLDMHIIGDNQKTFDEILLSIISLCTSNILKLDAVYGSLLGRSSPCLLQYFCDKEDVFFHRNKDPDPDNTSENYVCCAINSDGSFNHREALLCSLKQKSHFLENIMNVSVEHLWKGNFNEAWRLLSDPLLIRLQPLVLIHAWYSCTDDVSAGNVIHAIKSWKPNAHCDDTLIEVCQRLQYNVTVTEWCINNIRQQMGSEDSELLNKARNIFTQLQTQSPLRVIHKVFGLRNVNSKQILELLSNTVKGSETEGSLLFAQRFTSLMCLSNSIVFRGYLAVTYVMEAILLSCELDQVDRTGSINAINTCDMNSLSYNLNESELQQSLIDSYRKDFMSVKEQVMKHGYQATYLKLIIKRLENVKQELRKIFPLAFRIEILENLFSLLFVSHNDLHDSSLAYSDSDEGHEGEDRHSQNTTGEASILSIKSDDHDSYSQTKSVTSRESVLMAEALTLASLNSPPKEKFGQEIEVNKKFSGRFVISTVKLKDSVETKNEYSEIYSGHGSSRSTDSSSSNCFLKSEFLCNELIVRDLISILKDAILDANAEVYKTMRERGAFVKEIEGNTSCQSMDNQHELLNIQSSVSESDLPQRMRQLSKYVNEAQWRFELVRSDIFKSGKGKKHSIAEQQSKNVPKQEQEATFPQKSRKVMSRSISFDEAIRIRRPKELGSCSLSGTDNLTDGSNKEERKVRRKRKHKRSFREWSSWEHNSTDPGIIQRMLSSPDALLRFSLWRGNLKQADQVIKLFNLQSSAEAKEVSFAKDLKELTVKIEEFSRMKRKNISQKDASPPPERSRPVFQGINAIANAAASGIQSTAASSVIDQLLSISTIPEISEVIEQLHHSSSPDKNLLQEYENLYSMVLADLAYTSCPSQELSSILLNMALRRWTDTRSQDEEQNSSKKKSPVSVRGSLKTIHMMKLFLKELESFNEKTENDLNIKHIFFPPQQDSKSFPDVLECYLGSFNHSKFQEENAQWHEFFRSVEEFNTLLKQEEDGKKEDTISEGLCKSFEYKNKLHTSYKKLMKSVVSLKNWSTEKVRPQHTNYVNYLHYVFVHLQQVTAALLDCKTQSLSTGTPVCTSYFSTLKESPSEILHKIVFQNGAAPENIEKLAARMKVDMVHVLTQACFPCIPLIQQDTISAIAYTNEPLKNKEFPCIVLNLSNREWPSPRHPDLVAQVLMKDLLAMIQDIAIATDSKGILTMEALLSLSKHHELSGWISECSELAYVDLNLLGSKEEQLAFFVNVTNIFWIHAILGEIIDASSNSSKNIEINDVPCVPLSNDQDEDQMVAYNLKLLSPFLCERLIRQKIVGYSIGQIGVISLFDLRYQVLHAHFPIPKFLKDPPLHKLMGPSNPNWMQYTPPLELRLLFVLCEGLLYSPKLQVMYSEILDDALEEAMKDYFDFHIKVDSENGLVVLPQLLEWYSQDFVGNDDIDNLSQAPYEGLINLIASFVRGELATSLQFLISLDSIHGFSENIDFSGKKLLPFVLEFQPPVEKFGILLDYSIEESNYIPSDTISVSPNLASPHPEVLIYLQKKCWILAELFKFIDQSAEMVKDSESTKQETTKEENLTLPKVQNGTPIMQHLIQQQTMWTLISDKTEEKCKWFISALSPSPKPEFIWEQVKKCFKLQKWQLALEYIYLFQALSSDKDNSDFALLKEIILHHLASLDPSPQPHLSEPWCWAMCIDDPSSRVDCILQNIKKWPENACFQILKYCLTDRCIKERKDLWNVLNLKLREITLYRKIVDTCKLIESAVVEASVGVFCNWQEVADFSVNDPPVIFYCIKNSGQYHLAAEWADLHPENNNYKMDVLEMKVLALLKQEPPNVSQVKKVFQELEDHLECVALCEKILPVISNLESKFCLIQILVTKKLDYEQLLHYSSFLVGLKMLMVIESRKKVFYEDLVAHPNLLLEQLLMNMEIKEAEKAIEAVSEIQNTETTSSISLTSLSINQLVETYASKALELLVVEDVDSSTSTTTVLSSTDIPATTGQFVMPACVPSKEDWIPNAKVKTCQVCKEEQFNMFSRRHHCRRCGRIICGNCSQNAMIVDGYGNLAVRVCDECYNQTMYNTMTGSISSSFSSSSFDKRVRLLASMKTSSPRNSPGLLIQETVEARKRTSTVNSVKFLHWMLSPDNDQNAPVRNEFSYEQAPSISLCLSILKLHSDPELCAKFMLSLYDILFNKIKPKTSGKPRTEVDYNLVISMMKSLLINVKAKFLQIQNNDGVAHTETYLQRLDLIKLLINANCKHLIPSEELASNETVRKLRDKLLEEERMVLALEVSTKCGLDHSGVWSTWGLLCLRAGDWVAAREKFQLCLKMPKDRSKQKQENPLLKEVISCLESWNSHPGIGKASAIYRSLESLKNIKKGIIQVKPDASSFDGRIKEECLFYLGKYGTHISCVSFYQRHGLINEALNYILEKKCEPDIFVEALFMPCLKCVQLSTVQNLLTSSDPDLLKWWNYLIFTCRYLEHHGYLNVLYQIQLFMEDYIRAAKSSINFYLAPARDYTALFERHHLLHNARKHFERYLENHRFFMQSKEYSIKSKRVQMLPVREVESYIRTVTLQQEVSHFFELCKLQNSLITVHEKSPIEKAESESTTSLPTLFGNNSKKFEVAAMILINAVNIDEGFDLSVKVIKEYNLSATAVLNLAGRQLVYHQRLDQIPHFLQCLKCCFSEIVDIDDVILECIKEVTKQSKENKDLEHLVKLLKTDANKINAYLLSGKLKSAYLLAVKLDSASDVKRVLVSAEQSKQEAVRSICEKWLQMYDQKTKRKEHAALLTK